MCQGWKMSSGNSTEGKWEKQEHIESFSKISIYRKHMLGHFLPFNITERNSNMCSFFPSERCYGSLSIPHLPPLFFSFSCIHYPLNCKKHTVLEKKSSFNSIMRVLLWQDVYWSQEIYLPLSVKNIAQRREFIHRRDQWYFYGCSF